MTSVRSLVHRSFAHSATSGSFSSFGCCSFPPPYSAAPSSPPITASRSPHDAPSPDARCSNAAAAAAAAAADDFDFFRFPPSAPVPPLLLLVFDEDFLPVDDDFFLPLAGGAPPASSDCGLRLLRFSFLLICCTSSFPLVIWSSFSSMLSSSSGSVVRDGGPAGRAGRPGLLLLLPSLAVTALSPLPPPPPPEIDTFRDDAEDESDDEDSELLPPSKAPRRAAITSSAGTVDCRVPPKRG
uniref:Uncharacterized protein n=1 Tax=Anopheles coluzzii TaxID=1518534 RepID=A0A8W7P2F8_ANOCL